MRTFAYERPSSEIIDWLTKIFSGAYSFEMDGTFPCVIEAS